MQLWKFSANICQNTNLVGILWLILSKNEKKNSTSDIHEGESRNFEKFLFSWNGNIISQKHSIYNADHNHILELHCFSWYSCSAEDISKSFQAINGAVFILKSGLLATIWPIMMQFQYMVVISIINAMFLTDYISISGK